MAWNDLFAKLFASQANLEQRTDNNLFDEAPAVGGDIFRMAPLAIGAAVGFNRMKSNSSVSNMPGFSGTTSGDTVGATSSKVGDNLRRMREAMEAQRKKQASDFMESIMREGNLENTIREASDKRKATFAALLEHLDDTTDLTDLRSTLTQAMESTDDLAQDQINRIRDAIRTTVETGGPDAKSAFRASVDRFGGLAAQLATPSVSLKGISPNFNPISDPSGSLGTKGNALNQRLRNAFQGADISYRSVQEFAGEGGTSIYARVRTGGSTLTVPLQLAQMKTGANNLGAPIFRMGQMNTTYVGKQTYISAEGFNNLMNTGKPITANTISTQMGFGGRAQTFMDMPEAFMREVETLAGKKRGGLSNADVRYLHMLGTKFGTNLDRAGRPGMTGVDPFLQRHLQRSALYDSSFATIIGMEKLSADDQARLVASGITDAGGMFTGVSGGKADITRIEEIGQAQRSFGQIGFTGTGPSGSLSGNSPLNSVRVLGRLDPILLPLTARVRQMIGRPERFVNSNAGGDMSTVKSTLGSGKSIRMYGQNLGFTAGIGGINSAVLMDMGGGLERLGLGEGMAYWGMRPKVQSHVVKSVMDPHSINRESSALLENLLERRRSGAGPLEITGKDNIAAFFKQYGAGEGGGVHLGFMDKKPISISKYSDLESIRLSVSELVETGMGGRRNYSITGDMIRGGQIDKVFGQGGKVTTTALNDKTFNQILGRLSKGPYGQANIAGMMSQMGLKAEHMMINEGAMMSKAPYYLANQMLSSIGLQKDTDMSAMYRQAQTAISGGLGDYDSLGHLGKQRAHVTSTARFTAQQLSGIATSETAGRLGLSFGAAMSMERQGKFGLQAGDTAASIRAGMRGVDSAIVDQVIASAEKEQALGAFTFAPGTPSSTMRSTMSSMEPRTYQFMHHRLSSTLGMSGDSVADFMTAFMARKAGNAEELTALKGITQSVEGMGGLQTMLGKDFRKGLQSVKVADFIQGMGGDEHTARKFLSQYEKGFMLDFAGSDQSLRGVTKHFSNANQIYMPGKETLDALKGTKIVQGGQDLDIHHEFVRRTKDFQENLARIQSGGFERASVELAEAQAQAGQYREAVGDIFGKTWKGVLSGKLTGSALIQGAGISLGENFTVGFDQANIKRMMSVFGSRSGEAVFADGQAFLDAMRGYMGGARKEMMADGVGYKDASRRASNEMTNMFRSFFTGMEERSAGKGAKRYTGISALLARHPQVGPGHVSPSSIFRSDFGAMDDLFDRFVATEQGASALKRLEKASGVTGIDSFKAVARAKSGQNQFFRSMAENIDAYAGEGKGRIWFPEMKATVHYTSGGKHDFNFSKAALAMGDFDADMYQLMPFSDKRHKMFREHAMQMQNHFDDMAHHAVSRKYFEEAGTGIKNLAKTMGESMTGTQFAYQEQMKEFYAKKIGQLNTNLDIVRLGMTHAIKNKEDARNATRALAMLEAVQEVGNIKGKKLPKAIKLADMLTASLKRAIDSGGSDMSQFRQVLEQSIFRDSNVFKDGLSISQIELHGFDKNSNSAKAMRDAIRRAEAGSVDEVINMMGRGMAAATDIGIDQTVTAARASGMAGLRGQRQRAAHIHAFHDAKNAQGAMLRGEVHGTQYYAGLVGEASDNMKKLGGVFSSKALGPLALGAMGTLALGMATGDSGYRPKPMIMPGEVSDHRVNSALAAGQLHEQRDHHATAPPMQQDRMNLGNRPINMQQTYFNRSNPYNIRGQVTSMNALGDISNWVNSIGGSSAVRINDTRMPITPNYIDRITGD